MFSCRLYYNTGFDPVNVPATPAVLESAADRYADFGPIDIHQSDFQTAIKIRCPHGEDDVIGADYLKLSGQFDNNMDHERTTYYSVTGYNMTSPDVAVLDVVQDSFLTAGGVDHIRFMDGITVRHHVVIDDIGLYTEEDPMLVPSEPLELVHSGSQRQTESDKTLQYFTGDSGDIGMFFDYERYVGAGPVEAGMVSIILSSINLHSLSIENAAGEPENLLYYKKTVTEEDTPTTILKNILNVLKEEPSAAAFDRKDYKFDFPTPECSQFALFSGTIDAKWCVPIDLLSKTTKSSAGHEMLFEDFGTAYQTLFWPQFQTGELILQSTRDTLFTKVTYSGLGAYPYLGKLTRGQDGPLHPDAVNQKIERGIRVLRMFGAEGAIKDSYTIPGPLVRFLVDYTSGNGPLGKNTYISGILKITTTHGRLIETGNTGNFAYSPSMVLMNGQNQTGVDDDTHEPMYEYDFKYANAKNNRVFTGKYNRYILMCPCSGAMTEANPEDLIDPSARYDNPGNPAIPGTTYNSVYYMKTGSSGGGSGVERKETMLAPYIAVASDPRPTGRPYFNFIKRRGGRFINFYDGAVPGMQWQKIPVKYTDMSGVIQSDISYKLNRAYKNDTQSASYLRSQHAAQQQDLRQVANMFDISPNSSPVTISQRAASFGIGTGISTIGDKINYMTGTGQYGLIEKARSKARHLEDSQYAVSTGWIEPEITFLPSETLREATGNGVFYARYRLSDNDIHKFDKILTRYGYRDARPVDDTFMINRSKFNYLQVAGAVVKNDKSAGKEYATIDGKTRYRASQAMLNDISNMFAIGIRIWHVKPTEADFNDNPINTPT